MTTAAKTTLAIIVAATALLAALSGTGRAEETRPPQPAGGAKTTAGPECVECNKSALYLRQQSLQETLLTTRQRYAAWLAEQPAVRKAVEFGPWLATPPLPTAQADQAVRPAEAIDPNAKRVGGQPLWSPPKDLVDGQAVKFLTGSADTAIHLTRTMRAPQSAKLTVGIGGGEHLDVWLNGRKLASVKTRLTFGRYGCSDGFEGTRVDQVQLDLDLQAGENSLVIRLTPGGEPSFYFSPAPHPVPGFWEQLRRDFPAAQNPLLDLVHADWFGTPGWFASTGSQFEEQQLDKLAGESGDEGQLIREELAQLKQAQAARDDRRWLDLCVQGSVLATLRRDLARLRAAVMALGQSHAPEEYPAGELLARLDEYGRRVTQQVGGRLDPADATTRSLLAELPPLRRQMLVDLNPLLRGAEILFVKRYTYNSKHYYDDFQHISAWGGNLCVLSLTDGRVRELAPQLAGGLFDRYDLSFDARRIVFGYRRPQPEGFRIYEIGADGSGLRQVTQPPAEEDRRIATYGRTSYGDGFYGLQGYQFWTDDVHPCYLPDGGLCFASTRSEHGVLCTPAHYLACSNLFRLDGGGLRPISHGALSEFTPTMMEDGRILYNRWEYVYKGIAAVQPLWTTRPDGSGGEEFYGDNIANPGVFWQARQVPGHPRLAVCLGCGHEPLGVGQVLLLDLSKNKRTPEPITNLTPDVKIQNLRGIHHLRNGVWREDFYGPLYSDPYPLSDKFFLVSCNPDRRYNDRAAYGIHLLDIFGNRVPIYHDPEISAWQPMPLRPRPTPPVIPDVRVATSEQAALANVFVSDVYRGLEGVPPGTVKYLRVMEQIPKPWAAELDQNRGEDRSADGFGGHLAVSWNGHIWVAVLHGVVPVEADGSARFQVPAGRNLFFQALDENFMEIQRMRTFVNFLPGESRSCIGCHEHRTQAPESRPALAFAHPPATLAAQPGEVAPRPLYYPTDVQPILDRHCVRCHNGQDPKAPPDLRGELTAIFSRSYENILQGKWVNTIQEWNGGNYAMMHADAVPPYTYGSHRSRLVELLRKGHYDAQLDREEFTRLVTWIDCGAPYYGSYYGRRNLTYQGQPDFRPVPTLSSACGIAPPASPLSKLDPLPAQLIAWWPLDELMPDVVADASGQSHAARAHGAVRSEGQDGRGARRFDGQAYLESGGLGTHEAVSIALWVKAETLAQTWNPLLFGDDIKPGTVHFSLLSDGIPNVAINTGGENWTHRKARTAMADGKWHHVILVCDARVGGSVRFYVDGRLSREERLGVGQRLDLDGFRIGAWNRWASSPANNFHGELDDVRIYRGMLSDEEAAQLAKGPSVGK
ncbi:MAG: LamG domain-containing protein [Planctomycetota bacterium]|nr:LamG domain-containing protein [Planctomycetota bacterium]